MTSLKRPLHQRIDWPEWVDMEIVARGIYRGLYAYFDATGINVDPIRRRFENHRYYRSNDSNQRCAAMWYAVMKTAIETYGLKARYDEKLYHARVYNQDGAMLSVGLAKFTEDGDVLRIGPHFSHDTTVFDREYHKSCFLEGDFKLSLWETIPDATGIYWEGMTA